AHVCRAVRDRADRLCHQLPVERARTLDHPMEAGRLSAAVDIGGKRPVKIRIKRLIKRFRTLVAIDDVSLDIEEGTFFAIVGPSGCGQTTMLRILGGLETQTSGEAQVGRPARGRPQYSTTFQRASILQWMTVRDHAAY